MTKKKRRKATEAEKEVKGRAMTKQVIIWAALITIIMIALMYFAYM